MNLHDLVSQLIIDTKGTVAGGLFAWPTADSSLGAFTPELCLCATIVLVLFVRVFSWGRHIDTFYLAFAGSVAALYLAAPWDLSLIADNSARGPRMEIFTGMLVYDPFTIFMRGVLTVFAVLFLLFMKLSGIPDREDGPDIYTLVLGATLGMCLMASANHLLMVFMAVEMASVPSYVLAGMLKGRRLGSEAALKYSVYGAGAAGVMLYGISLIAGLFNTAHMPTLTLRMIEALPGLSSEQYMVLTLGGLMIMVGLAFKLSAVPFHFWCPDVFEGACAEVNAFLSVASKAAALALLVRVAIGFGAVPPEGVQPGQRSAAVAQAAVAQESLVGFTSQDRGGLFAVDEAAQPSHGTTGAGGTDAHDSAAGHDGEATAGLQDADPLSNTRGFIGKLIGLLAVITCTFGNLAAYGQSNIKRLLAYSTIAHAGYMMMPVSAMMVMAGRDSAGAEAAVAGLSVYIGVYLFMNLGAFVIVAFLRNAMQSEEIADYAGLIRHCPGTVICFSLILFSLVGLPPLAGFIGKFAIFASLVDGYQVSVAAGEPQSYLMVLLVVGGLNTAISLFYYLRVVKAMTIEPDLEDRRPLVYSEFSFQFAYVLLLTFPTAGLIVNWNGLNEWALAAASQLLG